MNHVTEREKELYRTLKNKVKKDMKDVVTNLIHRTRDTINQEAVDAEVIINEVSKAVTSSDSYRTLKRSLVMGIVDEKCQQRYYNLEDTQERKSDWDGYLATSFASLNSSLLSASSQCSYVILGIKDLHVATKLLRSSSLQDKLQSLNVLRQTSSLEQFLSPQVWPSLQLALKETLLYPVVAVGEFCLDVYINMMACSSPLVVKESYYSLLEFLSSYKDNLETLHKNYSPDHKIFIHAICITNKFQQCISKHWLRYPQNIMDDIVKYTFKHFSLSVTQLSKPPIFLNVWTVMTIIDTDNTWLKNWLHGRMSRRFVVNAIQEHPEIIERMLKAIYEFANEGAIDINNQKKCKFLLYEVSCSACFLSYLLQYSEGRKLISNTNVSEDTDTGLCDIWNNIVKCILAFCHNNCRFYRCNTNFASQTIYNLWENTICTWNDDERFKILKPLILPLEHCKMDNVDNYIFMINEITKLLSVISMADSARIDLCHLKLNEKFRDVIDWLINESGSEKFGGMHNFCNEILINMVKTCRNILSTPCGILWSKDIIQTLILIQSFQTCWSRTADCDTPTSYHSITDKNEINPDMLHKEILKAILMLLSSPLGANLLSEANYLLESIDYLNESYSELCYGFSLEQNCSCYSRCFTWFSLYSNNIKAIEKNELLLMFPNKVWQTFNFHFEDYDVDPNLKYIYTINKLKNLVFLYPAAASLYSQVLCKMDTSDVNKMWKSICLLLLDGIFLLEEQIKLTGSSILCSLVCNVKTLLFLEQKLQIREFLQNHLNHHVLDGVTVIDDSSLLWNHILVRSYIIGGPKERKLPPKCIRDITENYNWPFVLQESVNENYWQIETKNHTDEQSIPFTQPISNNQNFYQEVIINHLKTNEKIKWQNISILIEEAIKGLPSNNVDFNYGCTSVLNLTDSENIGIELAIQYGINLGLFDQPDNKKKELECTLKTCKISIDGILAEEFDIFVATVFLLMKGDCHRTYTLVEHYVLTQSCLYNWILPLQISLTVCHKLKQCHAILSQYFEVILKESLPKVFSAFQICGLSPSAVLWHWTSQCFWNYLDWDEICHWMLLTTIFGNGTIMYFAIAVMKHLEQDILIHAQNSTLLDYLKENSISEFQTSDYMNLILQLSEKFNRHLEISVADCVKG